MCLEKEPEVRLCFQGIQAAWNQASNGHHAKTLLKQAGIDATEEEWERAKCIIWLRRGVRPPRVAVTMRVRPNTCLQQLVLGLRMVGQHKPEIWVCARDWWSLPMVLCDFVLDKDLRHAWGPGTSAAGTSGVFNHVETAVLLTNGHPHWHAGKPVLTCGDMESKRQWEWAYPIAAGNFVTL